MQKAVLIIGLIFLIACSGNNKKNQSSQTNGTNNFIDSENNDLLGIVNKIDTLKILVEFSECGEWGGHRESIFLNKNEKDKIQAHLQIDTISCDILSEIPDSMDEIDKYRVILLEKDKTLDNEDEKLIASFINRLLELYLKNGYSTRDEDSLFVYQGSGTKLEITNTNSTFNLSFWNIENYANTRYSVIRDQIFNQ